MNEFISRVAGAQRALQDGYGTGAIEASDGIIKHFNRNGLNGGKYFIYQNIKVYPIGKTEEIELDESTPIEEKLHGTEGGTRD